MLSSDLKLVQGKARADAVRDINIMILENEQKLKKWLETELPILCRNLSSHPNKMWSKFDDEAMEDLNTSTALAQALSVSKVIQGKLEMQLSSALERCDASNSEVAELNQVSSRLQDEINCLHGVVGSSKVEGGFSRLWELYAPTGNLMESTKVSRGEPNPTMQNLLQEVDGLRSTAQKAEQNLKSSESERSRLQMWLNEARGDAEEAQHQLSKRVTIIRSELEARHGKEITSVIQRNSEQQTNQAEVIGNLRGELVQKEGKLQDLKMRLQLNDGNGDFGDYNNSPNFAAQQQSPTSPQVVQIEALNQERDFLLQKNDKLIFDLKASTSEKFELEQECERLITNNSSINSDLASAQQELAIHRSALRALEESVSAALTESVVAKKSNNNTNGKKTIATPILARSLASSKLAESKALHLLKKSSHSEMKLRLKVEELERHTKELGRLARGVGKGDGDGDGDGSSNSNSNSNSKVVDINIAHENSTSPWVNESLTKLRERVSTQASAIAYLELRIAQFLAETNTEPGDSSVQNIRRDMETLREEKQELEFELNELKIETTERNILALHTLDVNSSRTGANEEQKSGSLLEKLDGTQAELVGLKKTVVELTSR